LAICEGQRLLYLGSSPNGARLGRCGSAPRAENVTHLFFIVLEAQWLPQSGLVRS